VDTVIWRLFAHFEGRTGSTGWWAAALAALLMLPVTPAASADLEFRSLSSAGSWDISTDDGRPQQTGNRLREWKEPGWYYLYWDVYLGNWKVNEIGFFPIQDGQWHTRKYDQEFATAGNPAITYAHYYWAIQYRVVNGTLEARQAYVPEERVPDECVASTREPINLISGDMFDRALDIFIPCPGIDIELSRHYISGDGATDGSLGIGWSHSYDWSVATTDMVYEADINVTNQNLIVRCGKGRTYTLPQVVTNGWSEVYDMPLWFAAAVSGGGYNLDVGEGIAYQFDANGVLSQIGDEWGNTVSLTYTNTYPSNLLIRVEHNCGLAIDLSYQSNRLAAVSGPTNGISLAYSYDGSGALASVCRSTSSGTTTNTYAYAPEFGNALTQRVSAAGNAFSYSYATNEYAGTLFCTNMVLAPDYYAHTVTYDPSNGQSSVTYDVRGTDQTYTYEFDPVMLRVDRIVGPGGTNIVTEYYRDPVLGHLTNAIVRDISTSEYITTELVRDPYNGQVTNQLVGYCASPTNRWQYTWEAAPGELTGVTDPEGAKAEFAYTNSRLSTVRLFYNATESYDTLFSYNTNGLPACVTNANGNVTQFSYDSYGRLSRIQPAVGPSLVLSNSVLGHVLSTTIDGSGTDSTVTYAVDELGRVQSATHPDNLSETFSYDATGNLTEHVDRAGRTTRFTYLPTGKPASVSRVGTTSTSTISYTYDQQFNTLHISDALGREVESYVLDIQDRPTVVTNLEGQTMSVTYGLADFIKSIGRFDGTVVSNGYNGDGWLSSVAYPDVTNRFTYLRNGLLKTAANNMGTVTNVYSMANRLTGSVCLAPSGSVSYAYYPAGQVSNATSVAGSLSYTLDAADRISAISDSHSTFNYTYNEDNGLVAEVACPNSGVVAEYAYDSMSRVTSIAWHDTETNVLRSFSFAYDAVGMVTNVTREDGSETDYTYDDFDRLTAENVLSATGETTYNAAYSYDAVGNRLTKDIDGVTVSYATNQNRLTEWDVGSLVNCTPRMNVAGYSSEGIGTNPYLGQTYVSNQTAQLPAVSSTNFWLDGMAVGVGTQAIAAAIGDSAGNVGFATNTIVVTVLTNAAYGYSAAGCLTNIQYSGVGVTNTAKLSWNDVYQLTSVTTNGAVAEASAYDALGRRAYTASNGATNWYVYDGIHAVAEVDGDGDLLKSYTRGPGIDNLLAFTDYTGGETNTYYALTDHLGTVHAVADENANIVESYRYDAWGRVLGVYDRNGMVLSESAIGNHYLWQGRWYSWNTGLYYFRARWYDPITGRWLSKDPIGISGGLNQYVFVDNNPVNFVDPFGLWAVGLLARALGGGHESLVAEGSAGLGLSAGQVRQIQRGARAADTRHGAPRFVTGFQHKYIEQLHLDNLATPLDERSLVGMAIYNHASQVYNDSCSTDQQRETALFNLGIALHAFQDIYAHGRAQKHGLRDLHDKPTENAPQHPDFLGYSWAGNRYSAAQAMTAALLQNFFSP